jgi:hypothetical protein
MISDDRCKRITQLSCHLVNAVMLNVCMFILRMYGLIGSCSILHRITGLLDFFHRPVFLGVETRRFGNRVFFRSQVKGFGPLERADLTPPSPEDGNRSSFRNVVFLLPVTPDDGKSTETSNSMCYTSSSEPFKIYSILLLILFISYINW